MAFFSREDIIRYGRMEVVGWVPKPGDEVSGTVVNRTIREDAFDNGNVLSVITELDIGEPKLVSVAWFGILDAHAKHHDPQPGDFVYIKRLPDAKRKGEVPKDQEATYKNYRVLVHKALVP